MKLEDLPPGTPFRLPDCGKTGVLLSVGAAGARVKYDGVAKRREFDVKSGDEVVGHASFEDPGRPVVISSGTEVEVIG